jgi:NAD+ kinase
VKRPPKIALLAKQEAAARVLARRLHREFLRRGADILLDEETARSLGVSPSFPRRKIPRDRRLVISLGGDGTLLSSARAVSDGAEILGVNLGTLGFLTGVSKRQVRSLVSDALEGNFQRDVRRLLEITVSETGLPDRRFRVLNDAVLNRGALSRIARFTLRFDGKPFSSGSTAYNLSAGGPLLHPHVFGFIVTPICPHALTHRPIVLPAGKVLEVSFEAGTPEGIYLTLDGQEGFRLPSGCLLSAGVARRTVTLLRRPQSDYFETLSEKLNWGV